MRVVSLLCLCLLSASVAGCLGDDEAPTPAEASGPSGGDGGNQTAEPVLDANNTAPTANLTASATNGTAPLNVTFSLDGSDADGDNLTWTFTVGNTTQNGTALPATVNVTLEAGDWNATLTVSDGRNETAASVVVAVAAAAGPPAAAEDDRFPLTFSQGILLSCPHCLSSDVTSDSGCLAVLTDDNGLDCAFWEIPPEAAGRSFTASGTFLPVVEFYPDCSGSGRLGLGIETGTVPEGAGCAVLFDPVDPLVTAVLVIE